MHTTHPSVLRGLALMIGLALPLPAARAQSEPVATRPTSPPVVVSMPPATDTAVQVSRNTQRRASCWRATPLPECKAFFLMDFGFAMPALSTNGTDAYGGAHGNDFGARLTWTVGVMRNSGRNSHGVALSLTSEENRAHTPNIAEWRYRRWISASGALDAGLGYKVNDVWQNGRVATARGVTGVIGYTPNHWVGGSLRIDLVAAKGRRHGAMLLGVHSGRLSEVLLREGSILMVRSMLAAMGFDVEDEEDK